MAWCCRVISALKPSFPKPTSTTTYISIFCRRNHLSQTVCSVSCLEEIAECGIHSLSHHPNPEIASFYQKGFSEISKEVSGRELHALCLKGFVPLSIFYLNTLVNMYFKFGCIRNARNVFNYMLERNEASWNNMMSGYVRVAMYREAIEFFRDMWDCGIKPSDFFIASVVTACNKSASMLGEGLQVHGLLVKIGLLVDVFVGTSLVHFYGIYGFVFDAQKFFDGMPYRNVVTWTSLMVGYSVNEELTKVIDTYKCIIRKNISCNENTMALVIRTCGMLGDDLLGLQMHGNVMKSGLVTNVSVANSIIAMYCSVGRVEGSCYIFDHMNEHDTISWNSIISAHAQNGRREGSFRYFHQMRHVHKEVNAVTLSSLLTACSSVDNLKWGRGIHALVIKMGLESNEYVGNTLLKMYSTGGRSEDAGLVFQRMPERDLISWNSLVACYVENEECRKALELFGEMLQIGRMNYVTLTSSLAACTNTEFLVEGKILHALAVLQGLQNNLVVGNALVTMYGKTGRTADAKKVLLTMPHRDEVTCNSLIGSYAENREPIEAIRVFNIMRDEGIKTNYITMINLLGACLTPDTLTKHGMPIHAHLILTGFVSDIYVQSSLLTMYARCGELNSSRFLFDGLANKNSILWNAIIAAHASNGCKEDALKLILEMRHAGFDLDQFSLSEALSVCADLAILEEGQQLHGFAIKLGLESDHYVTNAAMDMYGKCGEMENVLRMVPLPLHRSRLSWNTLISSFARHGCFQKAMEIFHEMLNWGKKPDHVTFVSLLTACSHGGLVDEGLAYYASMTTKFGIPPGIEHCVNIVDLLGRSGRLAEAENFIKEMPVPPNDIVWRSLLASCKVHTNLELGRKAAECLLRLDPTDDSAYVLYSNVCATTGRWDDVENVRSIMGLGNIKKQPACSWVKLKDQIYKFGMGDNSHPQSDQIYSKLSELMKMLREAGYIADTSYALQDTDEEQKEHNLWNHSERIALAFGLLNAPKTSPVRVFKNLRVCGDCHSVYKYVSRLIGRKIILRDPYRFHHFTDGKCSCSDYW